MKPTKASSNEVPRVRVEPDEGKIFEADFLSRTFNGRSADFVEIDRSIAERIGIGDDEALHELLTPDPDKPNVVRVQAGKVQLNCLDGITRYIATRRVSEVYDQ